MFIHQVDNWSDHLQKAVDEGVCGNRVPNEDPGPTHQIWRVRKIVDGREGKVYSVHVWWYENSPAVRVSCQCHGHRNGRGCKHVAWVLSQVFPDEFQLPARSGSLEYDEAHEAFSALFGG